MTTLFFYSFGEIVVNYQGKSFFYTLGNISHTPQVHNNIINVDSNNTAC